MKFNNLKGNKGLTLIEVLIAAVLLTITTLSVMATFSSGYIVMKRSQVMQRANELARQKIEEIENQAMEDIYPADENRDNADGYGTDKILTSQKTVGTIVPGSDVAIYCPQCGYLNLGYNYYDWDLETYTSSIPTICQNPDKFGDGSGQPCGAVLPVAGQIGYYTREVKVVAHKLQNFSEATQDYEKFASDPCARKAPLKEIMVRVSWMAGNEVQHVKMKTLMALIVPKYAFK